MNGPNDLANAWTQRGIALLNENTPATLREAIGCFDRAIGLRRSLPLEANPWFRFGLIAGWINRGDALTRLGSRDQLREALQAYAEAFTHLHLLPIDEHPAFRRRLAIAWLNRGLTLQLQRTASALSAAIESFGNAIAVLTHDLNLIEDASILLAGAWINQGLAWLQMAPAQPSAAADAARKALSSVADSVENNSAAAEISFKARLILCQAVAHSLAQTEEDSSARDALIAEATDAVDDGMAQSRHWEERAPGAPFRPLVDELFRFGAWVYQRYQPHFLTEFLLENLDPEQSSTHPASAGPRRASAMAAMSQALVDLQREAFKAVRTPGFAEVLARVADLRDAEARLTV